jgi:hypothetical protein
MRTAFFGIAAAVLTVSSVFAADFPPSEYEGEYRELGPPVVVAPPPPMVTEVVPAPVFVTRPVVVVRPPPSRPLKNSF